MTGRGVFIESPSYGTMHQRLGYVRGRASAHPCARCGGPAREWAYDHEDTDALTDPRGRRYSADPAHYVPLCVSCHRTFDQDETCRRGHPRTTATTYEHAGQRFCRTCRRLNMRELREKKEEGEGNGNG
jgi:hypothetical protein